MKRIINVETGEVIERELNDEELAQQAIDEANIAAAKAIIDAELAKKASEKEAILNRLGLTAEELKTILG